MNAISLENVALFAGLDPEELEDVRPIFERVSFDSGHTVVAEGEQGQEMFILIAGKVRVLKSMLRRDLEVPGLTGPNARKVLATLDSHAHPVFGEMALIDADIRSASVETLEPCQFLMTDRERFFALAQAKPELGCKLLTALCRRMAEMVRSSNQEVVKLTTALALLLAGKR
jgi:CRP-like cAMP-binding protein